jgi:hypothetical protein
MQTALLTMDENQGKALCYRENGQLRETAGNREQIQSGILFFP